jgi:hypothetical protein
MLRLAGIEGPGGRALVGAIVLLAGVARHGVALMAIGGVLIASALFALLASGER